MPEAHRFTLVRKAAICAALATLLAPAMEAARPTRTPTTSLSARARERPRGAAATASVRR